MAGRRFFTAEACVFRIITKGQKGMANKSFADVQEFLKGKVILVANRGIPARRICRSIRERFDAVAAMTATDVDKTAPSASTAKELILLGPDPRAYLDIDRIIDKARQRGVVGIHPGWGFASEDTRFPQRCKEAGITFIGATAEAMNLLGNKVQARAVGYHSLATVEFLVTPDGTPYMIEVNTRLQVEHGITECRYGIDLVEEQIAVAFGAELRYREENLRPSYCAMQVRINCENPQENFAPNAGLITRYVSPGGPGVRLDSNISAGYEFPANYDSAGSLLIAYAHDWEKTLGIMDRALSEYIIGGIKTTIPFHRQILKHPLFRKGEINTNFVANHPELMQYRDVAPESERLARLVAEISAKGYNPHVQLGEYRSVTTPRLGAFDPVLPPIPSQLRRQPSPYPQGDRRALLDFIRDSGYVHFTDTTPRDFTQSNSGNRFRLAEDRLIGPYLDNAGYFSIENGGGAHFHVAMLANMTYPFSEAKEWKSFAPKTLKQLLVRSTNVLGYTPQPRNLMRLTGEMICDHYEVVRCFDFLNHVENMRPIAEVVMDRKDVVFQPAISLSWAKGFDVNHYLGVTENILRMMADIMGADEKTAARSIILGLKDMAGVCPPRFMTELVTALRKRWPELVLHYHRHCTDGLFIPACGAAAKAGAHIIDVGLGSAVRSYGQGDVLATVAYMEDELGLECHLNKDAIRDANFVCKQIMPYYDRYCSPYFKGIDYDVTRHGMPGGATSSSQEGAMKQGYIHLLPYMLKFLEGTRQIVRYHDVTPGSQITWNTAFLAVTGAWKRGGEEEVRFLLEVLNEVTRTPESELSSEMRKARLNIYQDCNDAFRKLLLGKFGRLPLGFPADWVYESAFGSEWKSAIANRTEVSPLESLPDVNLAAEEAACTELLKRKPTKEEFVLYLNHPADALKTMQFRMQYGDPNNLPLHVWFEGLKPGQDLYFNDRSGKPHHLLLLSISRPNDAGVVVCRYVLDSEIMSCEVQVAQPTGQKAKGLTMADPANKFHVASPSNGDLWVMYVHPGDIVKAGEELFNVSIMKQEKAVLAPVDGVVKRVLKTADFKENKQMVSVREGELLVELGPVPRICSNEACAQPIPMDNVSFCPYCGSRVI